MPIEPRGVVADWIPSSDELTLYTSTQIPHFVRTFVAAICGIPESKVRVIAPDVGGGFGSKLNIYAEEFAIAQASRLVAAAPVKWIEARSEAMVATIHGRDQLQTASSRPTATAGCRRSGSSCCRTAAPTCSSSRRPSRT